MTAAKKLKIELPDSERGRSEHELRELDRINARLERGYKPHRGRTADEQRQADLARREELELRRKRAAEEREAEAGIAETIALARARGEDVAEMERPGETGRSIRRQSGLDWLWSKGRLEPQQMAAGLKYGDVYRRAYDVSLRSCVAGMPTGGGDHILDARMSAQEELSEVRRKALSGHEDMIEICDQVAGEGLRIRAIAKGEDARATKLEAVLCLALDLVAKHYGMKR